MKPQETGITRRDFLAATTVLAGAGMMWHYGGTLSFAQIGIEQIPHEGRLDMPMLGPETIPALAERGTIGDDIYNAVPRLALDAEGRIWASAVLLRNGRETLVLRSFEDGQWGPANALHSGSITQPALVAHGGALAIAWAERRGWNDWQVVLAFVRDGSVERLHRIPATNGNGGIAWRPALASAGDSLWLAYEERPAGEDSFHVRLQRIPAAGPGQMESVAVPPAGGADRTRPHLAAGADGATWLVWDEVDGQGGSTVFLASADALARGENAVHRVTHHRAFNNAPAAAVDGQGRVWVAWHSNRRDEDKWDIPRWYYLRCYDPAGDRWYEPEEEPPGKDLEKTGTDQGFEFPRLAVAPDGKVLVTGRPSHNFCLQMLGSAGWSQLYRLPQDGWGGRGQFLGAEFDAEGNLWVIRRDLQVIVLNKIEGLPDSNGDLPLREVSMEQKAAAAVPLVNIQRRQARWDPLEDLEGIDEPLHHYYGDLHGHTWMSDGTGDVDEYFRIRREYYEDDFASLTDHDTFVHKHIFPTEFDLMNEYHRHYDKPGEFVTLFGQEYTTGRPPNGVGHKCLYHTDPIPLLDHRDPAQDTGAKLAERLRELGGIMIPHHVGWTGTDWENHDPQVQPLVEIVSNHGVMEYQGNRPIPHRGGMRGHFVQDGLAKGLKFGLIGGSDNHGLIWHHKMAFRRDAYRTGLAVVLAPELTKEALFDAMKRRRTYATSGNKPRLDFRVNDHMMGEEIQADGSVLITAQVIARERLRWLQVIKDNELWYEYGGEGYISRFTVRDNDIEPGTHWYYLRVIFDGPDMAWSSPIWVTV